MFKDERVVAEGTVFFSIYDGDDPEKKPILKWTLLRDFIVVRPVKVRT